MANSLKFNEKIWDYGVLLVMLFVFTAELLMLGRHSLYMDEGVYSSAALRIADGSDILQRHFETGKFPLVSGIIAFFILIFGNNDTVIRIPGMIASLLTFIFIYKTAVKIYDKKTGFLTAAMLCSSKYFLVFGPTAFMDPFMTMFLCVSLYLIISGRYISGGLFLGLAFASKFTSMYFVPVFLSALYFLDAGKRKAEEYIKPAVQIIIPFAAVFCTVFIWAALFECNRLVSFTEFNPGSYKGIINYETFKKGLENLIILNKEAAGIVKPAIALISAVILLLIPKNIYRKKDIFIFGNTLFFYLMMVFMAARGLPVYDRYLVVIMPFMALALARGGVGIFEFLKGRSKTAAAAVFILIISLSIMPFNPEIKMGALYDGNDGIKEAAEKINKTGMPVAGLNCGYYVMTYYFYGVLLGDYGFSETDRIKNVYAQDEREGLILLAMLENGGIYENPESIPGKFGVLKGLYRDRELMLYDTVKAGGKIKYGIYGLKKTGKDKIPVLLNSGMEKTDKCVFGGIIALNSVKIGGGRAVYEWKMISGAKKDYRIYVHFKDGSERLLFTADHEPARNLAPFGKQEKGAIINDTDYIDNPAILTAETAEIGLYDRKSGKRLKVTSGSNRFALKNGSIIAD